MQLGICERSLVSGLTLPDDRARIASRTTEVTFETINRGIELPTEEPLSVRRFPVENCVPLSHPLQLTGLLRPVSFRIAGGLVVNRGGRNERRPTKLFARRKLPIFLKQDVD